MSERDRQVLLAGGIVAGLLLFYLLLLRPLGNAVEEMDTRLDQRRTELQEMRVAVEEIRKARAAMPKATENVNLLSYLEGLARQTGVNTNIEYMKAGGGVQRGAVRRNSVELKLSRVNLKQLTNFLFQVERGGRYPLNIDEIHIKKRFDNPELMDVTVEVYQG